MYWGAAEFIHSQTLICTLHLLPIDNFSAPVYCEHSGGRRMTPRFCCSHMTLLHIGNNVNWGEVNWGDLSTKLSYSSKNIWRPVWLINITTKRTHMSLKDLDSFCMIYTHCWNALRHQYFSNDKVGLVIINEVEHNLFMSRANPPHKQLNKGSLAMSS